MTLPMAQAILQEFLKVGNSQIFAASFVTLTVSSLPRLSIVIYDFLFPISFFKWHRYQRKLLFEDGTVNVTCVYDPFAKTKAHSSSLLSFI
jgi:hypothetical protein